MKLTTPVRIGLLCLALFAGVSCNSSPTVPVPPPTVTRISVTEPDNTGHVTVVGEPETAEWGDVVLVFNDNTGEGAMKDAESDGSFTVVIAAERTHVLVIQIKRDGHFSPESELTVD